MSVGLLTQSDPAFLFLPTLQTVHTPKPSAPASESESPARGELRSAATEGSLRHDGRSGALRSCGSQLWGGHIDKIDIDRTAHPLRLTHTCGAGRNRAWRRPGRGADGGSRGSAGSRQSRGGYHRSDKHLGRRSSKGPGRRIRCALPLVGQSPGASYRTLRGVASKSDEARSRWLQLLCEGRRRKNRSHRAGRTSNRFFNEHIGPGPGGRGAAERCSGAGADGNCGCPSLPSPASSGGQRGGFSAGASGGSAVVIRTF